MDIHGPRLHGVAGFELVEYAYLGEGREVWVYERPAEPEIRPLLYTRDDRLGDSMRSVDPDQDIIEREFGVIE